MPNVWEHHRPNAESTCVAPDFVPYGRWNVDEIIWAALPSVVLITAWRMLFCHVLGPYLGGYVARRDTPDPHPKPEWVETQSGEPRLAKLKAFHRKITLRKSQIPKKKKQEESAIKKSDEQLGANIKRRVEQLGKKTKRKRLVLPKGLSPTQCPENLVPTAHFKIALWFNND